MLNYSQKYTSYVNTARNNVDYAVNKTAMACDNPTGEAQRLFAL